MMGFGSFLPVARHLVFCGIFLFSASCVLPTVETQAFSEFETAKISSASTVRLQNAVRRFNTTLAYYEDGEVWRRDLMLNILEAQSAKGEQADVQLLQQIHERFINNAADVDDPAFTDVRDALKEQIALLMASQSVDLTTALAEARGQFRSITIEDMSAQRDLARDELLLLKAYYRKTMLSRDRANLFYDMKLNEAIEFLDTIEFELAPEFSVGKIESMIRDVENQLEEVILQIDAIPLEPEPETGNEEPTKTEPESDKADQAQDRAPTPDQDQKSMKELQKEKSDLEAQIQKLKQQRIEVRKSDAPRRVKRSQIGRKLIELQSNFAEIGRDRGDPYFVSAEMAFERFLWTYTFGTSDNLQEDFLTQLATLENDLQQLDGPDQRAVAAKVGNSLQTMERYNQIPHVVAAIRARHSLPNAYISISARFMNAVGAQPVSETQRVRENIGGRLIRGVAKTNGIVSFDLVDDPNQIHANIRLQGSVGSGTYAQQGKTQVFANTTGQVAASRSIYANIGGLIVEDAQVSATFCSNFAGTNSGLKLVNRIAEKAFNKAKAQGERKTAENAEVQVKESFVKQTDEPLGKARTQLAEFLDRLVDQSQFVPEIYVRSFSSEVMVIAKKATLSALAAQELPAPSIVPTDVAVRLNDSTPSIYLDKTFAGKTYTDQELAEEIGRISGDEPIALTSGSGGEDESFSITFATVRPVQFEFADNRFSVIVSGRRFAQGDKKINEGLKIILRFKIKRIDGQLKFVRDGDAEVDYLNPELKRPVTVAFRSFLLGRLNPKEGGEQISADLPDNLIPVDDIEALQDSPIADRLDLVQCRSENGWLYLGWNYRAENTLPVWQVDLPAIWNETVDYDSPPPVPAGDQPDPEPAAPESNSPQPTPAEPTPAQPTPGKGFKKNNFRN